MKIKLKIIITFLIAWNLLSNTILEVGDEDGSR
jgi:hypothetical protein